MWFVDKAQWDVNGKSVHQIMDTFHFKKGNWQQKHPGDCVVPLFDLSFGGG